MSFEQKLRNSISNLAPDVEQTEPHLNLKGINPSVYSKQTKNSNSMRKQSRSPRYRSPIQCKIAHEQSGKHVCPTCEKRLGTGPIQTFHDSPPRIRPSHHNIVCEECSEGSYSKILKVICINEPQPSTSETKKMKIIENSPESNSSNSFAIYGSGQTFQILHEEVLLPPKPELTSLIPDLSKENNTFQFRIKEEERKRVAIRRAEYANRMKGVTKTIITTFVPGEEPKRILRQSSLDSHTISKNLEKKTKKNKEKARKRNEDSGIKTENSGKIVKNSEKIGDNDGEKRGISVERGRVRERLAEEKGEKKTHSREKRMKYLQQIRDESLKRNLEQSKVSVKHKILAKLAEKDFAQFLDSEGKSETSKSEESEDKLLCSGNSAFEDADECQQGVKVEDSFKCFDNKSIDEGKHLHSFSGNNEENKKNSEENRKIEQMTEENFEYCEENSEKIGNSSEKTDAYSEKTEDYSEVSEEKEKPGESHAKTFNLLVGKCLRIDERPEKSEESRGKSDEARSLSKDSKGVDEEIQHIKNHSEFTIDEESKQDLEESFKSPNSLENIMKTPERKIITPTKVFYSNSPPELSLNNSSSEENVEFSSSAIEDSIRNESPQPQYIDHPLESFESTKKQLEYAGNSVDDSPYQDLTFYDNQHITKELTSQLTIEDFDTTPVNFYGDQTQLGHQEGICIGEKTEKALNPENIPETEKTVENEEELRESPEKSEVNREKLKKLEDSQEKIKEMLEKEEDFKENLEKLLEDQENDIKAKIEQILENQDANIKENDFTELKLDKLNALLLALTDPKVLKGLRLLGGFADYLEKDGRFLLNLE